MFHRFHPYAIGAAVVCVSLGVTAGVEAQSTRGELAGNVADPTGAAVAGATITATNDATGGKNVAISTSAGAYRFTALPIGTYTVTATAAGFSTASNTGVQVQINTTSSLNITLQLGAVADVVTVDASGEQIQAESAPMHAGALTGMGEIALPAKNYSLAESLLLKAEQADPNYAPPHYFRGLALVHLGRRAEADTELHSEAGRTHLQAPPEPSPATRPATH